MKKVIMLGGGGFAREVLETIDEINRNTDDMIVPLGFIYDGGDKERGKLIHELPVLGDISYLKTIDVKEILIVASVGRSVWRRKMVEEVKSLGAQFLSIKHPSTFIGKYTTVGEGFVIQAQCTIQRDIKIGDFFVGNDNVGIGHDTIIGDFVHANPKVDISGECVLEDDVFLGTKATVLTSRIGKGSVIGACALVTKDVPPNVIAKGIPAKYYEMGEKKY